MTTGRSGDETRGHGARPRTADVRLEAWGADLAACIEELAAAVIESCADVSGATPTDTRDLVLATTPIDGLILDLVDELIFCMDAAEGTPVACDVSPAPEGFSIRLHLADRSTVEQTGSVPKGVSRSGLELHRGPDGFRCVVLLDV